MEIWLVFRDCSSADEAFSPGGGGHAGDFAEAASEVALVGEADFYCDFGQRA